LTKSTFTKSVGRRKNVDYKNVGPKNVATCCKILTKILEILKKNVVIFLKNVVIFLKNVGTFLI
jgi:hypothetical protein